MCKLNLFHIALVFAHCVTLSITTSIVTADTVTDVVEGKNCEDETWIQLQLLQTALRVEANVHADGSSLEHVLSPTEPVLNQTSKSFGTGVAVPLIQASSDLLEKTPKHYVRANLNASAIVQESLKVTQPCLEVMSVETRLLMQSYGALGYVKTAEMRSCYKSMALSTLQKDTNSAVSENRSSALHLSSERRDGSTLSSLCMAHYVLAFYGLAFGMCIISFLWVHDEEERPRKTNGRYRPEVESWNRGLWDWLMLGWVSSWMIRWGNVIDPSKTKIKAADLDDMGDPDDETWESFRAFDAVWRDDIQYRGSQSLNLFFVIFKFSTYRKVALIAFYTGASHIINNLGPAFAIEYLLNLMTYRDFRAQQGDPMPFEEMTKPIIITMLLFAGIPLSVILTRTATFLTTERLNVRLQAALASTVIRKAQRLPAWQSEYKLSDLDTKEKEELGKDKGILGVKQEWYDLVYIVNTDIGCYLMNLQTNVAKLFTLVPVILVLLCMLCARIGTAIVITLAVAFVSLRVLSTTVRQYMVRLGWAQGLGGYRTSYLQECLRGIRIVKTYAWEEAGQKTLQQRRGLELVHLWWYYVYSGGMLLIFYAFPRLLIVGSLAGFVLFKPEAADATNIFVIVQLLAAFRNTILILLATLPEILNLGPSIRRLDNFLKLPEVQISKKDCKSTWISVSNDEEDPSEARLSIRVPKPDPKAVDPQIPSIRLQGTFKFPKGKEEHAPETIALHDADVKIYQGEMVAIVGEVGSGKSTLLHAMLGELEPAGDARVEIPRKIGLCTQVPLLCEGTLKDNVLYWSDYDDKRYNEALFAACIQQDLDMLPGGDAVLIGSRGISLSGGQRVRVSLARAAYCKGSDVVFLDDPFASVDAPTGNHLMQHFLLGPLLCDRTRVVVTQPDAERLRHFDRVILMSNGRIAVQGSPSEVFKTSEFRKLLSSKGMEEGFDDAKTQSKARIKGESSSNDLQTYAQKEALLRDEEFQGRSDWGTYHFFFKMGGYWRYFVCIALFLGQMIAGLAADLVLVRWSNDLESAEFTGVATPPWYWLLQYTFWLIAFVGLFVLGWWFGMAWSLSISGNLFTMLIERIFGAPIDRFFDKTPVGRIMNRMGRDLQNIDANLFFNLSATVCLFGFALAPLCYLHAIMPVYFNILSALVYFTAYVIFSRYLNLLVPIKYLCVTTRSTWNTFVTDAPSERISLRAYQVGDLQWGGQISSIDDMLKAHFAGSCAKRWATNRLLVLFGFFSGSVAVVGVISPSLLNTGQTGLCITSLTALVMVCESFLDQVSTMQDTQIAMNRIEEYSKITQEAPAVLDGDSEFVSFTTNVARKGLNDNLERFQTEKGDLHITRAVQSKSSDPCRPCKMCIGRNSETQIDGEPDFVLEQQGKYLVAPEGSTLAILSPVHHRLKDTTARHRIANVNGSSDIARMVEDLCYGTSEDIKLEVQSNWLRDSAHVEVSDLVVGYADSPNVVLRGVNLTVKPRAKVAIAGTTGCGKSTFLSTVLRILEPRAGYIKLDGVDIQNIGLKTLRRNVGIVPQDPTIFSGTIRSNLDPFEEYTDQQIWDALKAVELAEFVSQLPGTIYCPTMAEGGYLSFGQRQLVCIGRMVLRKPPLLLLDEATSAIDPARQEKITKTIREQFADATIIAVAHRLETVLDFDEVIVMDRGQVAEHGTVKELSMKQDGIFAGMLAAAGFKSPVEK
jgi:ABC-type multidrug transport system fused ATPase/permease subunit